MKIAFLCSGQGSQYLGMGKELYDSYEIVQNTFQTASDVLGYDLPKLCFTDQERLNQTEYTQPALLTLSVAIGRLLIAKGIQPNQIAGFSLGEYSALVLSGVLSFEEALPLVVKRGLLMQEAVPKGTGGMSAVIGLDIETIQKACLATRAEKHYVSVANINIPGQTVISGTFDALEIVSKKLMSVGARTIMPIQVSGPFHTNLMRSAGQKLETVLEDIPFNENNIPVLSNVTGKEVMSISKVKPLLVDQIQKPVNWQQCLDTLKENGTIYFIEIGPGNVLTKMTKRYFKGTKAYNVENIKTLEKLLIELNEERSNP